MRKTHAFGGLAALVLMAAAPMSLAQTDNAPATPPATTQPATPPAEPTPPANPNPVSPTSPPEVVAPSATPASAPQGCRTVKPAGDACACLSDTSRVGQASVHPSGYNVCVRPN